VSSPRDVDQENGRNESECSRQSSILPRHVIPEHKFFLSGSLPPENALSPKKVIGAGDR
jgi:serine/threonine-protein kinase OSR1/STK39